MLGLGIGGAPYSKSHKKRLKRKAKEHLSTDLKAVEQAIVAVNKEFIDGNSPNAHQGQIGENKDASLTAKQRQRTLYRISILFELFFFG